VETRTVLRFHSPSVVGERLQSICFSIKAQTYLLDHTILRGASAFPGEGDTDIVRQPWHYGIDVHAELLDSRIDYPLIDDVHLFPIFPVMPLLSKLSRCSSHQGSTYKTSELPLQHSANVNRQDSRGFTALHEAAGRTMTASLVSSSKDSRPT
jgi:hypothetical protein